MTHQALAVRRDSDPITPARGVLGATLEAARRRNAGPRIVASPAGTVTRELGSTLSQQFSIEDAGRGERVTWEHLIGSERQTSRGRTSTFVHWAAEPGKVDVETTALRHTARGDVPWAGPLVRYDTKRGSMSSRERWSVMKPGLEDRGEIPVADMCQLDEHLVVTVELHDVADHGCPVDASYSGPMDVVSVVPLGTSRYRVTLSPRELGLAGGRLHVVPRGIDPVHITPLSLFMRVKPMTDIDDVGEGRARDIDDLIDQLSANIDEDYATRLCAVDTTMAQLKVQDPEPEPPLWQRLLTVGAMIALSAVTAGTAAWMSELVIVGATVEHAAKRELVKVLFESTATELRGGVGPAINAERDRQGGSFANGMRLDLAVYFQDLVTKGLISEKAAHAKTALTRARTCAQRLELRERGLGYRELNELVAKRLHADPGAHQSLATMNAWCTLIAQTQLPSTGTDVSATDVRRVVDVDRILPGEYSPVPRNLEPIPGVLRLELQRLGSGASKQFGVKRAWIAGFKNDNAVSRFVDIPIRDLGIPVVARFNEDFEHGFVVGRNERREFVSDTNSSLLARLAASSGPEAARWVLDDQVGDSTVLPRRG